MMAWWWRLKSGLSPPLLVAAMLLLAGGLVGLVQPVTSLFHETWAGLLLALMIAVYRPERAWPAMLAGGAALMIRELALPMILAMAGLAVLNRHWREAAGWLLVLAVFAAFLLLHAHWVSQVVQPVDLSSPGWSGLLGVQFALKSIAQVTAGIQLPGTAAGALLLLSLFGLASVSTGWAFRVALLLAGYSALLALLARADTFYWALMAAPLSYTGLIFLPRACADLVRALRQGTSSQEFGPAPSRGSST